MIEVVYFKVINSGKLAGVMTSGEILFLWNGIR